MSDAILTPNKFALIVENMVKDKKMLWSLYYKIKKTEDLEKKKEDLFQ